MSYSIIYCDNILFNLELYKVHEIKHVKHVHITVIFCYNFDVVMICSHIISL